MTRYQRLALAKTAANVLDEALQPLGLLPGLREHLLIAVIELGQEEAAKHPSNPPGHVNVTAMPPDPAFSAASHALDVARQTLREYVHVYSVRVMARAAAEAAERME